VYALGVSSFGSQSTAELAAELGVPVPVSRVYLTTIPRALPQGMSPYGPLVLSLKPDLRQQAAGQLDRVWERFYELLVPVAKTRRVVLTIWHEPDSKIRSKDFDFATWSAAFKRWIAHADLYRSSDGMNRPDLFTTMLNLTNGPWRWAKEDAGRYLVAQPDMFGLDAYQDVATAWLPPEDLFGPPFEWALTHGFRQLGVPEFGAISDPRRPLWIRDATSWLGEWDSLQWANYWTDRGGQFDVRTDTASRDMLRRMVLRHQGR
jgi:hypothetical protein